MEKIITGVVNSPYREFTYTIQPNDFIDIQRVHNSLRVLDFTGSAGSLVLQIGGSSEETNFKGAGLAYEMPEAVTKVRIYNRGGAAFTITVGLIYGKIRDDRLQFSGSVNFQEINPSQANNGQVSVTSAGQLIVAANANRKRLVIQNLSAGYLYFGFTNPVITGSAPALAQFGDVEIFTTGAVYARTTSGTCDCRYFEELI